MRADSVRETAPLTPKLRDDKQTPIPPPHDPPIRRSTQAHGAGEQTEAEAESTHHTVKDQGEGKAKVKTKVSGATPNDTKRENEEEATINISGSRTAGGEAITTKIMSNGERKCWMLCIRNSKILAET